jgi:hypothetical protein
MISSGLLIHIKLLSLPALISSSAILDNWLSSMW